MLKELPPRLSRRNDGLLGEGLNQNVPCARTAAGDGLLSRPAGRRTSEVSGVSTPFPMIIAVNTDFVVQG
ncbi:MAG: hypothetical protein ACJ8KC_03755, partial [Candidatus Udaeobacter sp.]